MTTTGPDAGPESVPWGESLVREYWRILGEWRRLDLAGPPGTPPAERERLAAAKLETFERAAVVRARAVNELLTIFRWACEDAPGAVESLLSEVVTETVRPELTDLADAVLRLEDRHARRGGGR